MAAADFSSLARGQSGSVTKQVTLETVAGNVREVIPPTWARRISVTITDGASPPVAQNGSYATSGTDGAGIGNDFQVITTAGLTWRLSPGRAKNSGGSIFLTSASANSVAQVSFEVE